MTRQQSPWGKHTRQRVAVEAARLMSEQNISDYETARRKAADRLGVKQRRDLPNNQEIEQELISYRSIFSLSDEPVDLRKKRNAALEAMQFLDRFDPRLVGGVLEGTAGPHDPVQLHIFSETPDEVVLFLLEKGIDFDQRSCRVKYKSGKTLEVPCLSFHAGDEAFELHLFSRVEVRHPPLSKVSGQTMRRADMSKLRDLLSMAQSDQSCG